MSHVTSCIRHYERVPMKCPHCGLYVTDSTHLTTCRDKREPLSRPPEGNLRVGFKERRVTSIDRSHIECCECRLRLMNPPRCRGHVEGPSPCAEFQEQVDGHITATEEKERV